MDDDQWRQRVEIALDAIEHAMKALAPLCRDDDALLAVHDALLGQTRTLFAAYRARNMDEKGRPQSRHE